MTGIRSSEAAVWLACALATTAAADEIALAGGSRLTGSVTAIAENGSVTLDTPLSPAPVTLTGGAIRTIAFSQPAAPAQPGDTRVRLVNGDVLPGELRALDGGALTLATAFAGNVTVPRRLVARLDLGVAPNRTIYDGPMSLEGWDADRWTCRDEAFLSQENGARISRRFDLPRQFVLRFHLNWRNAPNLQVAFAESGSGEPLSDAYLFQFNHAGIELKRQRANTPRPVSLTALNRPPEQFTQSEVEVEIRVDRATSKLQLLLDGQLEARIDDPTGPPPAGDRVSFRSNLGGEATHRITRIQLLSWNAAGDRHRTEERGDPKTDALIDAEGSRYSGELETIRSGPDGPVLRFKSPLLDKPMEIPAAEVSTVFLAADVPAAADSAPLLLKLQGAGELRAERCVFAGDKLTVRHPLLGDWTLKRGALRAVERRDPPPAASPK